MPFQKGHSINKGIKRTKEQRLASSLSRKGKPRRGNPQNWKHTKQSKVKISKSKRGCTPWNKGKKTGIAPTNAFPKGNHSGNRFTKGQSAWNRGKSMRESKKKGKTLEELYGNERARKLKNEMSRIRKAQMTPTERRRLKELRAKQVFPLKDTKIEVRLQRVLNRNNIKFEKHKRIGDIKYPYQCDILIKPQNGIKKKTVVECDGDYWHGNLNKFKLEKLTQRTKCNRCLDYERNFQLDEKGYKVVRLWGSQINKMNDKQIIGAIKC